MRRRPAILEIAWGKSAKGWVIFVGWKGRWEKMDGCYATKAKCMKAVTEVHKRLAGHPRLMSVVRDFLPLWKEWR